MTLSGDPPSTVKVTCPLGEEIIIPIKKCQLLDSNTAQASVIKDAGDDAKFDVTHGLEVCATVRFHNGNGIVVRGGEGVGVVTKPGLQVPVGEPAINPIPKKMIIESVRDIIPRDVSAEIIITVPDGAKIADKTFNSKLGIIGGISILGTTGVVKPRSLGVFVKSTATQIDVAVSQGYKLLILVPGSIGERMAKHLLGTPTDAIIQTGDFFGYMIKKAIDKGVKHIVILGHPGKLVKLAAGIFNTNHNVADARREVVAAYAALAGASRSTVETIFQATTTEEMAKILKQHKLSEVTFSLVADAVRDRVFERISGKAEVNVVIVSLHGEVLGFDSNIRDVEIWRKKFSWSALDPDPKNM